MPLTKAELRRHMIARRDAFSPRVAAALSARICARVLELPEVESADSVFTYVSVGIEVDTRRLISVLLGRGKTVAVPRIVAPHQMEPHRIRSLEDLVDGPYGISAPGEADPLGRDPDVAITPGVAFTERRRRLGRGGGYYDRYLSTRPGLFTIGLAYERQLVEAMPTDPHDQLVRVVVTESRVI